MSEVMNIISAERPEPHSSVEKPVTGGKSERLSKFPYILRLLDCWDRRDCRSTLNRCTVNKLAIGKNCISLLLLKETPVSAGALCIPRSVSAPLAVVSQQAVPRVSIPETRLPDLF